MSRRTVLLVISLAASASGSDRASLRAVQVEVAGDHVWPSGTPWYELTSAPFRGITERIDIAMTPVDVVTRARLDTANLRSDIKAHFSVGYDSTARIIQIRVRAEDTQFDVGHQDLWSSAAPVDGCLIEMARPDSLGWPMSLWCGFVGDTATLFHAIQHDEGITWGEGVCTASVRTTSSHRL